LYPDVWVARFPCHFVSYLGCIKESFRIICLLPQLHTHLLGHLDRGYSSSIYNDRRGPSCESPFKSSVQGGSKQTENKLTEPSALEKNTMMEQFPPRICHPKCAMLHLSKDPGVISGILQKVNLGRYTAKNSPEI